ncbi:hypothetical protein KGQ20_19280 [Catenulispora sp. NF23]|uniref:hypothetical protein n=1 Tax=Catenulispora pinistramenti TaxID=2705254 RepID=UPI001BA5E01C|nr:hypothetical protein [Catenulispora pinistramenti]MBS2534916.1 hypothetical protein [Catenulispora pinistramenti]
MRDGDKEETMPSTGIRQVIRAFAHFGLTGADSVCDRGIRELRLASEIVALGWFRKELLKSAKKPPRSRRLADLAIIEAKHRVGPIGIAGIGGRGDRIGDIPDFAARFMQRPPDPARCVTEVGIGDRPQSAESRQPPTPYEGERPSFCPVS